MPRVSVLMPVYNSEKYLNEAINSVLAQTYQDFELIIVDDGSVDESVKIIESYNNPKIKLIVNSSNERLGRTRNKCIEYSSGEYLVNLDSDDIAENTRLEKQIKFMDENPEVGVCGSWAKIIGKDEIWKYEASDELIKFRMLFDSHFVNSSTIIRKAVLDKNNIRYNEAFDQSQDYGLWIDMAKYCKFANIPEVLVNYRIHPLRITDKYRDTQLSNADIIRLKQVQNLGISISDEEKNTHLNFTKLKCERLSANEAYKLHNWLFKLINANHKTNSYNHIIFDNFLKSYWAKYVNNFNFSDYNIALMKAVMTSQFSDNYNITIIQKIKFILKCIFLRKNFKVQI